MTDLTITHGGGTRTFSAGSTAYRVDQRSVAYALRVAGMTTDGYPKVRGDGKPNPVPVPIEIEIDEGSLATSADLAWTVIGEAETATNVAWHEGNLDVDGILRYEVKHDATAVYLRLFFAPAERDLLTPAQTFEYDGGD